MQIDEERTVNDVMILDLKGKMILAEGGGVLSDRVNGLVDRGHLKILLNLEGVPFIDSAGLGEIVRVYTSIRRRGGDVRFLKPTSRVEDLLAMTKLRTVFQAFHDEAEAIGSFAAPSRAGFPVSEK